MLFAFLPVETRYKIVNDEWPRGTPCQRIETKAECEQAARQLGLSDTTAREYNVVNDWDPPFCYYVNGAILYFNSKGDSTGTCRNSHNCICKQ